MKFVKFSPKQMDILVVALLGAVLTLLQMWLVPILHEALKENVSLTEADVIDAPIILWWTTGFGEYERYRDCGENRCYFTEKHSNFENPHLKAIIFYGTNFNVTDLPLPRAKDTIWALLHEESPRNNPMFVHGTALELFNYSSTFSRHSDVPLTLLSLPGETELIGNKYFIPVQEKNKLIESEKLAPLLYIQSDCDTASDRDSYIAELMKHVAVDSYGACLNNRRLPESLSGNYFEKLDSDEFFRFVAKYKFTLAFENAICDDYITEKLWRPLIVGSVPIYLGSPSFKDWLPNNDSAIAAKDFEDPKDLAEFVNSINENDELYLKYLSHKLSSDADRRITNERLTKELRSRPWNLDSIFGYSVEQLECKICNDLLKRNPPAKRVTEREYNCPKPTSILKKTNGNRNSWIDQWRIDGCTAKILSRHVKRGTTIRSDDLTKEILKMYEKNDC